MIQYIYTGTTPVRFSHAGCEYLLQPNKVTALPFCNIVANMKAAGKLKEVPTTKESKK